MNICARCVGATTGHVVSFFLFLVGYLPPVPIALGLIAVMLLDWGLQAYAHIPSTNTRRVITGFLGGMGVGVVIWTGVGMLTKFLIW